MYRTDAKEDRSLVIAAKGGNVVAVDRRTGQVRWERRTHRGPVRLTVHSGRVFACAGAQLYILDYARGAILAVCDLPLPWATPASLKVDEGQLFIASGGALLALSLDGDLLWKQPLEAYGVDEVDLALMESREPPAD